VAEVTAQEAVAKWLHDRDWAHQTGCDWQQDCGDPESATRGFWMGWAREVLDLLGTHGYQRITCGACGQPWVGLHMNECPVNHRPMLDPSSYSLPPRRVSSSMRLDPAAPRSEAGR
jgi:hypothetical protein